MELASGKYDLRMITMTGRLGVDLLLNMRREHSLESFKLDHVATHFLRGKVNKQENNQVFTYSTRGLYNGNYVTFNFVETTSEPCYEEDEKFEVYDVQPGSFRIKCDEILFSDFSPEELSKLHWSFAKDDVTPQELFDLHAIGGPQGRAKIAKYCIQDCDLVLTLMYKLDTLVNTRGMADVCKVPMNYVLTRGQGIKIFSAVVYYASQREQIILTQEAEGGEGIAYEGAIVLEPKIGMYLDQPISVLDFNSLYPSNMIAYNLSPDTLVYERVLDSEGFLKSPSKEQNSKIKEWIANLEEKGFVFEEISYDDKITGGKTVCTFVQKGENPMTTGVIPLTLDILLKKRKEFKQKMEDEVNYDESQRSVFNGLQLAYKVVANSVYGQSGSRTSPIRKTCVAACTTAAGRNALYTAKRIVESEFGADVIYGDTDSIFIKFPTQDLATSIKLGLEAGKSITRQIGRHPYKIAYEKTLYPFILFCRKRYVGMKYEEDPNPAKAKQMSMGVVLKRRDNAPIVKDVFGGALKILMSGGGIKKAQAFVNDILLKIFDNKVALEKFIVSKSLRDDYVTKVPEDIKKHISKDKSSLLNNDTAPYNVVVDYANKHKLSLPDSSLAHRKLADRMAARDPGTAPKVGDRLQYVYVAENKHKASQGDRIEHVDYVKTHKLTPDTQFYITNQVQNPVAQLFALCIEELDGYVPPSKQSFKDLKAQFLAKFAEDEHPEEQATLAVLKKKEAYLDGLMFLGSPALSRKVKAAVRGPMDAFLRK
jgi:DNA polymerase delta subunit 1